MGDPAKSANKPNYMIFKSHFLNEAGSGLLINTDSNI
jgi:hypothetical protein